LCEAEGFAAEAELERLIAAAQAAHEAGLKVNAGHGISLETINGILRIPHLDTLNIGHSIVSHAVTVGIAAATRAMADAIQQGVVSA
jgi:pyridoxine 5-phosphate synthase